MAGLIHLAFVEIEYSGQIAGMADIHGIGDAVPAGLDGLIDSCSHEAGEFIILIGCSHESMHRKAHFKSNQATHKIPEVAAGNGKDRFSPSAATRGVGIEVVDGLGKQPSDVDRVSGG